MNREDIMRMAKEANASFETAESMFKFAKLVAAAEREECAKICMAIADSADERDQGTMSDGRVVSMGDHGLYGEYTGALDCAEAIKARSKE